MADRTGYQVTGLNALVRDLQAIGVEVEDLKDAFATIANEGARVASSHAPRVTGALADDIRGNRAKSKAVITAGRARMKYAGPINYGWKKRNIAPSGFMQKTDQEIGPRALQILEREINEIIRRKGLA